MLTQAIWWSTLILEAILIGRAFAVRLAPAFPIFYSYLATVFITSLSRFYIYETRPSSYREWYWVTEVFAALVGYGVILELYEKVLSRFQGVARFFKVALAVALLLAIVSTFMSTWSLHGLGATLENNLRLIQAVLLVLLFALLGHYRIPVGKNTTGIIVGYSSYIGYKTIQSVVVAAMGSESARVWTRLAPVVYLLALVVWSTFLWSYRSEASIDVPQRIENDYDSLVAATRITLSRARAYVARGAR